MKFESDYAKCYFFRAKCRAKKAKIFFLPQKLRKIFANENPTSDIMVCHFCALNITEDIKNFVQISIYEIKNKNCLNLDEVLKAQKGRAYFGMPGAQDRGIWYILGK